MVKGHTTVTIDNEKLKQAKEKGINISELLDQALANELDIVQKNTEKIFKCYFCKKDLEAGHYVEQDGTKEKHICWDHAPKHAKQNKTDIQQE